MPIQTPIDQREILTINYKTIKTAVMGIFCIFNTSFSKTFYTDFQS